MLCLFISGFMLLQYGVTPSSAWGGLFNRFSPEMLTNLGYGGHSFRAQPFLQVSQNFELTHFPCPKLYFTIIKSYSPGVPGSVIMKNF
ncbi:hypothetical protein M8J77_025068 [Diaphorina citri]|nr:hypothetical protein M8J77_025068 [Diaphorina citri]